jgi:hypothetical protein
VPPRDDVRLALERGRTAAGPRHPERVGADAPHLHPRADRAAVWPCCDIAPSPRCPSPASTASSTSR